jgi:hypothetical protein
MQIYLRDIPSEANPTGQSAAKSATQEIHFLLSTAIDFHLTPLRERSQKLIVFTWYENYEQFKHVYLKHNQHID